MPVSSRCSSAAISPAAAIGASVKSVCSVPIPTGARSGSPMCPGTPLSASTPLPIARQCDFGPLCPITGNDPITRSGRSGSRCSGPSPHFDIASGA